MLFTAETSAVNALLGKLVFSRVKYLQSKGGCDAIPALLWLTEQVKPMELLALHCTSTVYFALCQALEKLDSAVKSQSINSALLADTAAYAYHQQQYQDFSQLLPDNATTNAANLVVLQTGLQTNADLSASLSNSANNADRVLAVIADDSEKPVNTAADPAQSLKSAFSASLCLGKLTIYWQQGKQPALDYLCQQPAALSLLTQVTQFAAQALNDSLLASESSKIQQQLTAQQNAYKYLQSDKDLLEQQVVQQAASIERQRAELALLAQNKLQIEQANNALLQQQQQKDALNQQLEQQLTIVQQQYAELAQQHSERIAELVSLTQKLEGFTAEQFQLTALQQQHQQITAQLSEAQRELAQNALQLEQLALSQAQLQQLTVELKQLQSGRKQLVSQYNEMEKQRYLENYKLLEAQRALQQYQHETAQLTLMYQQQQRLLAANKLSQQALQQQLKQLKRQKSYKLGKLATKLVNPFAKDQTKQQLLRNKALIAQSGWFDVSWYLSTYPDVAANNKDPIEHFLKFGVQEGRNPHPQFDCLWYINQYPDVAEQGINPLLHFIKFGQQEGRATQGGTV